MTTDQLRLFDKLLDRQKELIDAIVQVQTDGQMEALRAIAEAQYNMTECLLPIELVALKDDEPPMTMQ